MKACTANSIKLTVTLLAMTLIAGGCKPAVETDTNREINRTPDQTLSAPGAPGAVRDLNEYTYAQRGQFVETMENNLADLNRELDQLSLRVERSSAEVRAETEPRVRAVRSQIQGLNAQLDQAKNASESGWEDIKSGVRKGYDEVAEGFQQSRQWVSDKIQP